MIKRRPILVIVFTGGPSGGKTTLIDEAEKLFQEADANVIKMTERATAYFSAGYELPSDPYLRTNLQIQMFRDQINFENYALSSSYDKKTVVLLDRGLFDYRVYCPNWEYMLNTLMLNEEDLWPRYDIVFYCETSAALGQKFYKLNSAREQATPDAASAVDQDRKTLEAWSCHKNIKTLPACPDFNEKMNKMYEFLKADDIFDLKFYQKREKLLFFLGMKPPTIYVKTLLNATLPERATNGSAGLDLFSNTNGSILPGERHVVPTGCVVQMPHGCYGRIAARSSLAAKGIDIAGGVVDRDYRGEIKVILVNNSKENFCYENGDKIAQLLCEHVTIPMVVQMGSDETFTKTGRGDMGFGSSGIKKLSVDLEIRGSPFNLFAMALATHLVVLNRPLFSQAKEGDLIKFFNTNEGLLRLPSKVASFMRKIVGPITHYEKWDDFWEANKHHWRDYPHGTYSLNEKGCVDKMFELAIENSDGEERRMGFLSFQIENTD